MENRWEPELSRLIKVYSLLNKRNHSFSDVLDVSRIIILWIIPGSKHQNREKELTTNGTKVGSFLIKE